MQCTAYLRSITGITYRVQHGGINAAHASWESLNFNEAAVQFHLMLGGSGEWCCTNRAHNTVTRLCVIIYGRVFNTHFQPP